MPPKKKEPSFEEQLAELEKIVTQMEAGGLSLAESLKRFEKGAALEKALEKQLSDTKRRLTQLMGPEGEAEGPMEDAT